MSDRPVTPEIHVAFGYLTHVRERLRTVVMTADDFFAAELTPNESLVLDLALDKIGDFLAGVPGSCAGSRAQSSEAPSEQSALSAQSADKSFSPETGQ